MGLSWSSLSVGETLATGVMSSFLYLSGHDPVLILVFIMSASGTLKNWENLFMIFAGMSPGIVALLVFIMSMWSLI